MKNLDRLGGLLWLCILLGFTFTTAAQTPICGPINTATWTPAGNPYIIGCDSTIPSGQTLTIQPGVIVWIGSNVTLTANGLIQALGTPTQRITFQAVVPSQYWNAISLLDQSTNRFKYCDFRNADSPIRMRVYGFDRTMVTEIMNCTFSNCLSQGIYGEAQGRAGYFQGCFKQTATLNPLIKNCAFYSTSNGCVMKIFGEYRGASCFIWGYGYANPKIIGNLFGDLTGTAFLMNIGSDAGGSGSATFINNTLVNCRTGIDSRDPWDARIQDNIFVGATNAVKKTGTLSLATGYNDFYGNATNFTGYPLSYGQWIIANRNGTLADLFFNISQNPQFVGTNDFHLATNSACVDAGTADPAFCDLCLSNSPSLGTQFPDLGAYGGPDACNWLDIVPKLPVTASISKSNNVIRISWGAIPRSEYQVQSVTNFALVGTNNWVNYTNGRVLATERPTSLIIATNTRQRFFRIQSLGRTPGN